MQNWRITCNITPNISLPEIYYRTAFADKHSKGHGRIQYVIPVFKIVVNIHKYGDNHHVKADMA
jgi:hypothetical protein